VDVLDTSSPSASDRPPGRGTAILVIAVVVVFVGVVLVRELGVGMRHSSARTAQPATSPSTLASMPVTAPPSAEMSSSEPAVRYPQCRAADLQVTAEQGGAATGNLSQPFAITNVGKGNCALQGYPAALTGWQNGAWHQLKFDDGTFFYVEETPPPSVELAPGMAAELIIGTSDACNGGDVDNSKLYTRLHATLPGGGTIELTAPVNAFCNLDVSSFHPMPAPQSTEPTPTRGPFDSLQFQMDAPTTAVEGSKLVYNVRVTNPTNVDIALSPCPTWNEFIAVMSDPGGPVTTSGPFYCNTTPSIPAHGWITIPTVIQVPEAVGMAKFVWWFSGMPGAAVEILTVVAG